jgi:CheY-like chemotaxis protein
MDKLKFRASVKEILNHLSDPAFLENHNLIDLFQSTEEVTLNARIQALRNTIQESINLLKPPVGTPEKAVEWRCYKILFFRYFQMKSWHIIEEELGLSQRQVQRDYKKGLDALISILWDHFNNQAQMATEKPVEIAEISETYDQDLIKEELKNWELSFELVNLNQIIDQALTLCKSHLMTDLQNRVDESGVDININIMVDQVLTKQGLYKVFSIIGTGSENIHLKLRTRKLNEYFIELSFGFDASKLTATEDWKIAQLFFAIQGLRQNVDETSEHTTISVIFPVKKQISCLVIDDVESVRRLIERMLGSYGIQVFGTDQYPAALNLIQMIKPDFILLDILMPKMDGWQMIKNLKSNPETDQIPVIICSVLFEPDLAKAVNAVAHIRKPINRLELIHTLQDLGLIEASD